MPLFPKGELRSGGILYQRKYFLKEMRFLNSINNKHSVYSGVCQNSPLGDGGI